MRRIPHRITRKYETVKTDFSGGFTDIMENVDKMLEKYYDGGQVETLVTDNGVAVVTVFPKKGDTESISIQLNYKKDSAELTDDNGKKKTVNVEVDKHEFDKLGESIIDMIDAQLKSNKKESLRRYVSRMKRRI
jgi:hypothetical protein